jgi:acyl-CoA:acyl-CoA alkyltransferase
MADTPGPAKLRLMAGNATYRLTNAAALSVVAVEAPVIVTSAQLDDRLAETLRRVRLRSGLFERLAGIRERRWWPEGMSFVETAVTAGARALAESGIDPGEIGLLIDTSVSKAQLEPSAAVSVHHALNLPTSCLNFDLSNACLGFVNAMQLAGVMIDAGQIDYALIVDGEGSRLTQERTIQRLCGPTTTSADVIAEFATLTLGSGAAAMVLGRADRHRDAHRLVGGVSRAATEHHALCVGDLDMMRTDVKGLFDAGLALSQQTWKEACTEFDWTDAAMYVSHQISQVHTDALCRTLDLDPRRVPRTFPMFGNMGPASIPFTLAQQADVLSPGDRIICMGIGSGLNASCVELVW